LTTNIYAEKSKSYV